MVISVGGNVGESQAAKLGSHFSLMMLVEVPKDQTVNLQSQLQAMPDMNSAVFESDVEGRTQRTPQIACKYLCVFTRDLLKTTSCKVRCEVAVEGPSQKMKARPIHTAQITCTFPHVLLGCHVDPCAI